MEEKFWSSVRLCLLLSLAAYAWLVKQENIAFVKTLNEVDAGYLEVMNKTVSGKKLHNFIDQDSVGVFSIGGHSIACATLLTPLPGLARRK